MNKIKIIILNILFIIFLNFYFYCFNNDLNVFLYFNNGNNNNNNSYHKDNKAIVQPELGRVGPTGGNITVSNLDSFNISELSINFQSIQYRKHTFQCFDQIPLTNTSIQCSIPKGFGTYIVIVKDDKVKSNPLFWSYKLGQLSKKNLYNKIN
ncbi:hypothetical protein DDB_G0289997 [Dictyostelium discoideum AX4]|uniref:Uncharacterized protein n=1 Tax=Dictyostelium discoideum TaxID=44689 RepID=Q54GQ4_DICDI|nr:hypothetical protein DDB_G0289997 [Dictyostelium discoideum AX4]EAL62444.1 hypothetical protein DDB_G0289997 [Dictyostelium discoideum AX4]|eukprot:XP_635948.1 hypothetical protein DDB_G0289997 [Dictyostelium discoideum AX4]